MQNPASYGGQIPLFENPYFVYLLKCADGTYYVGCTNNLLDRISRHSRGEVQSTKGRVPIHLEMYTTFSDKYVAFKFEKYLKSGSGRAFTNRHFIQIPKDGSDTK